jgi:hypothetical protein
VAAERWIDELVRVAGSVKSHAGGSVRAYLVFEKSEIPETIERYPCAFTYGTVVHPFYSDSGPCVDIWEGQTEFHLFPDLSMTHMPEIMRYYAKIRNAFALHRRLGGLVDHCSIRAEGIVLMEVNYGIEAKHHTLVVYWEVKENVTGEITLGQ